MVHVGRSSRAASIRKVRTRGDTDRLRNQCRAQTRGECRLLTRNGHRLNAPVRSSIRSRSTSHNLSDETSSLSISSPSDSSRFKRSVCHASDRLLDCRDRSLDRDVRLRFCSYRGGPISYPFLMNRSLSRISHQSVGAVVPNSSRSSRSHSSCC